MLNNNWGESYYSYPEQGNLYCNFNQLVFVNDFCKVQFFKAFPRVSVNALICHNALDFRVIEGAKTKYNTSTSFFNMCFVGRLVEEKNPMIPVRATEELLRRGYNVTLSIIGDGYLYDEIADYIIQNKLSKYITLYGYIPNPYKLMSSSKLLISMSQVEGGPLCIAEAYYMMIPTLSSHSGGSDAFARKYGGVKFVDKHPNHVADTVEELISDNMSHYNELRKEIKPYLVGQDYSPQKIVSFFDKIRLSGHS